MMFFETCHCGCRMSFYLMFTEEGEEFRIFYCMVCDRGNPGCPRSRRGVCPV